MNCAKLVWRNLTAIEPKRLHTGSNAKGAACQMVFEMTRPREETDYGRLFSAVFGTFFSNLFRIRLAFECSHRRPSRAKKMALRYTPAQRLIVSLLSFRKPRCGQTGSLKTLRQGVLR